jgi:hypothetical protein
VETIMITPSFNFGLNKALCGFQNDSSPLMVHFTQTDQARVNLINRFLETTQENQMSFIFNFLKCWLDFQEPAVRDLREKELLEILPENHKPLLGFNLLFVLTNKEQDLSAWCGLPDEITAQEARNQHYLNIKLFSIFGLSETVKSIIEQICDIYREKGKELTKFQQLESSAIWLPIKFP